MRRILVIDDSELARLLVRAAFESDGHEVLEAVDGKTGLEIARSETLDCILLDLLMPGKSGRDILRKLRDEGIQVPVLVLTADVQKTTHQECIQLGAKMVINKPKNPQELRAALDDLLEAKKRSD